MRKLVTYRTVAALDPIPGADRIEVATVDGWKVVVQKGIYKVGEEVVYFEVDSWIPHSLAPFLTKPGQPVKEYNGVPGARLRTVRLRGQLSQGLLMPLEAVTEHIQPGIIDLDEALGIQKWEAPIPLNMAGQMRGNLPAWLPKTDQERYQNCAQEVAAKAANYDYWHVQEKMEGSSMTVYLDSEEGLGVTSRNVDLKLDQEGNSFVDFAKNTQAFDIVRNVARILDSNRVAVRGELCGPGIQGNIYGLNQLTWFIFDIYDGQAGCNLSPQELAETLNAEMDVSFIDSRIRAAPGLMADEYVTISGLTPEEIIASADGPSAINRDVKREGLVVRHATDRFSFKIISNAYLEAEA